MLQGQPKCLLLFFHTPDGGFGANLTLVDVLTKEARLLLTGKTATFFQQIAPMPGHSADPAKDGAVWDPTGRGIGFIGVGKPQSAEWK